MAGIALVAAKTHSQNKLLSLLWAFSNEKPLATSWLFREYQP